MPYFSEYDMPGPFIFHLPFSVITKILLTLFLVPPMPPNHNYPCNYQYVDQYCLKVTSRNQKSKKVDLVLCYFCQAFGREVLLTEANLRRQKKNKYHKNFTKFNLSNIMNHMQYQHSLKWKQYIDFRDAEALVPDSFSSFFEQSKLDAFLLKNIFKWQDYVLYLKGII